MIFPSVFYRSTMDWLISKNLLLIFLSTHELCCISHTLTSSLLDALQWSPFSPVHWFAIKSFLLRSIDNPHTTFRPCSIDETEIRWRFSSIEFGPRYETMYGRTSSRPNDFSSLSFKHKKKTRNLLDCRTDSHRFRLYFIILFLFL